MLGVLHIKTLLVFVFFKLLCVAIHWKSESKKEKHERSLTELFRRNDALQTLSHSVAHGRRVPRSLFPDWGNHHLKQSRVILRQRTKCYIM